jgi:mRNA interferase YafQ
MSPSSSLRSACESAFMRRVTFTRTWRSGASSRRATAAPIDDAPHGPGARPERLGDLLAGKAGNEKVENRMAKRWTAWSGKRSPCWPATSFCRRVFTIHPLAGNRKNFPDCHIRPDLVLIYRKPDGETLELVRLGSHAELDF